MNKKFIPVFLSFILTLAVGWYPSDSHIHAGHSINKSIFDYHSINEAQKKIDVYHYDLSLDLFPADKLLKGNMLISGIIKEKNLKEIYLNFFNNLTIDTLLLNGTATEYTREKRSLLINSNQVKDTFNINIIYHGTPQRAGLSGFVFGEINKNSVIYNLNEPNYASSWFPCNDTPMDKALFDMHITNDTSKVSVSNGALVDVLSNGSRKTYHWKSIYPIATYLVCVYSADYVEIKDKYISMDGKDTMPVNYYAFPKHADNAKIDMEDHPQYIKVFSEMFGEYPFIKEKYGVAEFLWQLGAMEHQTITGMGSNFIGGRKFFSDIYIHELSHHWWGDAVSPATWNDIWLNEGFATYSEALYAEKMEGYKALQSTMLRKFDDDFKGILYQPGDNLFSPTVYDKGGWVLHMLRWEVGDSSFFKILRTYYEQYKYKNASTEDFRKISETISGKPLYKFFDQWIYSGEGGIKLDYTIKKEKVDKETLISINYSQVQKGYDTYEFPLEISFKTSEEKDIRTTVTINKKESTLYFTLSSEINSIELDPDNHLLASFHEK